MYSFPCLQAVLEYLQARLDSLKEDYHTFLGEKRNRLHHDLEQALFAEEKKDLSLLVGSDADHVAEVLELRFKDQNPFDDLGLCQEIIGELEFTFEDENFWRERDGIIRVVYGLYKELVMEDKAAETIRYTYYD